MNHYLQYHNGEKEGFEYLFSDDDRFGISTRLAHVRKAQGSVFLIVGVGTPRQYFLWETFEIDRVEEQSDGSFHAEGIGWRLCPPQRLEGTGFDAFKSSCANFVGFRNINDLPYSATLKKLAKKHHVKSAKAMKPFLQELLGILKEGTEDYRIIQKQLGPQPFASKPAKEAALAKVQKKVPATKIAKQRTASKPPVQTQNGEQTKHLRALSIRQPHAEAIMRGIKKIESRSMRTNIRDRVHIYASLGRDTIDEEAESMAEYRIKDVSCDDLPRGVLIGTVEVSHCTGKKGNFKWHLRKPERATRMLKPKKQPQPAWFKPF